MTCFVCLKSFVYAQIKRDTMLLRNVLGNIPEDGIINFALYNCCGFFEKRLQLCSFLVLEVGMLQKTKRLNNFALKAHQVECEKELGINYAFSLSCLVIKLC